MCKLSKRALEKWIGICDSILHHEKDEEQKNIIMIAMGDIRNPELNSDQIKARLNMIRSRFHEVVTHKQPSPPSVQESSLNLIPCVCGLFPELSTGENKNAIFYKFSCNESKHYMSNQGSNMIEFAAYLWNNDVLECSL